MAQQFRAFFTFLEHSYGGLKPSIPPTPGYQTTFPASVALHVRVHIPACRQNTHMHKININTALKTYGKELLSKENI
jgi:hypothetical protein